MRKFHKQKISIATLAIAVVFLSGCASMSSLQTARTTNKGKLGYGYGAGFVKSELPLEGVDTIDIGAPFMEVSARYGITDNLDLGAKITLIGTGVIDAKYQFLGDKESKIAGSAGLGLGYLSMSSGDTESKMFDIMVPMYFSYHPLSWVAVYVNPRYVLRLNSYSNDTESGSSNSGWYGVTTGIRLGKRVGFLLEYSYFGNSEISQPFSQVTGGIAIGIN
ncbi:MAG: hypothetical protein IMY72_03665 [Bacteroidetes bacterium]|nr:hypothetical protein [Bacteroidota bacterium]